MSDLDIIKTIEKQIGEKLKPCLFVEIMNANARGCYALDEQQNIVGLNLQNYKLSHFSFIKNLTQLNKLNLALNNVTDLSSLKKLNQLNELNLQKNEIIDISILEKLKNLKSLNLQANKISEIKSLSNLKNLNQLNLSSNRVTHFNSLAQLNDLTYLDLSDNQISSLLVLKMMTKLVELDLRFNNISDLTALTPHKKLAKLFLSSNQITDIYPLTKLISLTELYLNSNKIKDISVIKNLKLLRLLDLRSNRIDSITALENLIALTHLHLEANEISEIAILKNLTKLTQLNLRCNQISNIEALKDLQFLTHLYLSDNQIKTLPRWILNLNLAIKWNNGGQGISVIANPIKTPPPNIIRQGNTAIKNFFESQQKQDLNKVKVLLVGDKGVGKTSLARVLRGLPVESEQKQTLSIEINSWEQDDVCLNLWDFSGKENLFSTHRLFFSKRSLYILVFDNRKLRNEERWIKRIESFAEDASILIVLNKFDEACRYDLARDYLFHRYKSVRGIFPVSALQGAGIDVLQRGLMTAYRHIPSFRHPFSLSAFHIKAALEKQQQHCIPYQTYVNICEKQGLKDLKQQRNLLHRLHDSGHSVYFNELENSEHFIFEPQWLINGLYKIINAALISNNQGILSLEDLAAILNLENEDNYSKKQRLYLVALMKRFYLCSVINEDKILVPQSLKQEKPNIEFNDNNALKFEIQYNFLDEALILYLFLNLYPDIDFDKSSCYCLFLKSLEFNCSALLEVHYDNDAIEIKVNGEHKRDYYAFIRKILYKFQVSN